MSERRPSFDPDGSSVPPEALPEKERRSILFAATVRKSMEAKTKKRKVILWTAAAVLALLLLCAGVVLSGHVYAGGRLIPRDAVSVDLSGTGAGAAEVLRLKSPEYLNLENCGIRAEEYDRIRERFPDCEILWSVPLSGGPVSSRCTELTVGSLSESDVPLFAYFDALKTVHAEGVAEWQILSELEKRYPAIGFRWGVTLNGKTYSADISRLLLKEDVGFEELKGKLAAFTKLESVSLQKDALTTDEKLALQESYPDVLFYFTVEEFGRKILNSTEKLDFSGERDIDIDRLVAIAPLLKNVKQIDFTDCGCTEEEMGRVMRAYPEAAVGWQMEICGKEVSTLDEEIDLSGIPISDVSEIENALPYFRNLKKVVMCKCGVGDEEMDALNRRHEDVRFVWTIFLGTPRRGFPQYELRTDTTYFISSLHLGEENAYRLFDDTAEPLKYCTDMVALDLGHNKISKCEFCRYMPKLRFFIAAGSHLDDLSPLSECKELYYVELMFCPVRDLSPLLECKELRHLNVCACPTQDSVRPVLSQMTWLERCYMAGKTACYASDYSYVYSDEFLPNTEKWLWGMGFYTSWRGHPVYREMRDALGGAYYMGAGRLV